MVGVVVAFGWRGGEEEERGRECGMEGEEGGGNVGGKRMKGGRRLTKAKARGACEGVLGGQLKGQLRGRLSGHLSGVLSGHLSGRLKGSAVGSFETVLSLLFASFSPFVRSLLPFSICFLLNVGLLLTGVERDLACFVAHLRPFVSLFLACFWHVYRVLFAAFGPVFCLFVCPLSRF